ncbi:MAG: 23S rRNA (pseudouridine(1915)-N(3))-methyltransferase RlmH [Thermoleophilia bacterium]
MRVRLVCVGRLSRPFKPVFSHYADLLAPYVRLEVIEVPEVPLSRGLEEVRKGEGEALLRRLKPGALTVVLDRSGEQTDSESLSGRLAEWKVRGRSDFQFVVGGAAGLSGPVAAAADWTWSLSNLTFPHQLARCIVAEQLYRAIKIERGEPYHH